MQGRLKSIVYCFTSPLQLCSLYMSLQENTVADTTVGSARQALIQPLKMPDQDPFKTRRRFCNDGAVVPLKACV